MAKKYKKVKIRGHYACRIAQGEGKGHFANGVHCGLTTGPKKHRKSSKKHGKARKSASGLYRDKAGHCRKTGKRGAAKNSACKKAGI